MVTFQKHRLIEMRILSYPDLYLYCLYLDDYSAATHWIIDLKSKDCLLKQNYRGIFDIELDKKKSPSYILILTIKII